jgi:hypothetical protein
MNRRARGGLPEVQEMTELIGRTLNRLGQHAWGEAHFRFEP